MTKIVKKAVSKMTDETSIPLGGMDRVILNRVSEFLHRSAKLEKFSEKQWKDDVKTYFEGKCAYCGKSTPQLHKEHIIPINKDGLGLRHNGNIIPACSTCNHEKKKYDEKYDDGYVKFCKQNGYNDALAKIRQYMKDKGYKPFTTDETKKKKIKRLILEARIKIGNINEEYSKKIAGLIIAEAKK